MTFNKQIEAGLTATDKIVYSWLEYAEEKKISDLGVSPQWLAKKCSDLPEGTVEDSLASLVNSGLVEMKQIPGSSRGFCFAIKGTK